MEQTDLITRKQDEKDQRVMRVFLTETGEKAAAQSCAATLDLTSTMFNCLTPEEQAQMLALVEKISAGMESIVGSDIHDIYHHGMHKHHGQHGQHCRHHSPFHAEDHNPHRRFWYLWLMLLFFGREFYYGLHICLMFSTTYEETRMLPYDSPQKKYTWRGQVYFLCGEQTTYSIAIGITK